jgi:hypothetical protein
MPDTILADHVTNRRLAFLIRRISRPSMNERLRRCRTFGISILVPASTLALLVGVHAQNERPPNDAIARLGKQIETGVVTLDYRPGAGYLPSLLEHLGVEVDSQVLVFSKTSFQQALINPQNPRALYFNDHVSVGTVPGAEVYELLALDPTDGVAFYTLSTKQTERPRFQRRGVECLFCHAPGNKGAPALTLASVFPTADGTPAFTGSFIATVDHRTPFEDRWGGWYVTGTHGSQKHMGNAIAPDPDHPFDLRETGAQNLKTLAGKFDVSKHLTGSSDIVALMTLEHQVGMTNRINAVSFQYRCAERSVGISEAFLKRFDAELEDLVRYMLFADEAPLRERTTGTSTFARTFADRGPRDHAGRSLREFDLRTRLFRYPLSYMIYSELFDRMPTAVRQRVYQRLYDVLTAKEGTENYGSLSDEDRQAILEILVDTKSNLPPYWNTPPSSP